MSFLPTVRFTGQIRYDSQAIDVAFDAEIDETGVLFLAFDTLPISRETFHLGASTPDGRVQWAELEGSAETGEKIRSDTFYVTNQVRRTTDNEATVTFQGTCNQAVITRTLSKPLAFSQLRMTFPRFESFSWLNHEIDLGRVHMGGAKPDPARPQLLTGELGLQRCESAWNFDPLSGVIGM